MTHLLCKIFVENNKSISKDKLKEKYGSFASIIGIILNILLSALKLITGIITASVSVIGDAVNNLSDVFSYLISFISFKISAKPADREHPYGHARFEYFASLFVAFTIMLASFSLGKTSVEKIINGDVSSHSVVSITFLIISVAVKLWMHFFYKKIARKIDSTILKASAVDSLSDVIATSAILLSIALSKAFSIETDGYMGVLVALFILYSGFKIIHESMDRILGISSDPSIERSLKQIATENKKICGIHDVMIHNYGSSKCFASLHAEVDGKISIFEAHDIADEIENKAKELLDINCVVHIDPIEELSEIYEHIKKETEKIVACLGNGFSIHDFRIINSNLHTKLVFDISVPYESKMNDEDIIRAVSKDINKINGNFISSITVDRH